jgi:hypothetical protein
VSDQPHRNEPRCYRYPMQQLAAVLDEETAVEDALGRLRGIGMDRSGVHVLSEPEGRLCWTATARSTG